MTPIDIVDELTYRSYAHNRRLSPDVSPERWMAVFGEDAAQMEERFTNDEDHK